MKRGKLFWFMFLLATVVFTACEQIIDVEQESEEEQVDNTGKTSDEIISANATDHEVAADYTWETSSVIPVVFNSSSITVSSTGATASGSTLTITKAGTFNLSGSLTNGQVIVNTEDQETVRLILNNVDISCSNSAPIYIKKAQKVVIVLADNSTNKITDGTSYTYDVVADEEPNAAIFSKSNLSFYGNGKLMVTGNFNDGISTKDGLVIKSGTITVTAKDDGIRGKDYLIVRSGNITVTSTGDGLVADNTDDSTNGYILVETGTVSVTSTGDAIAAQTDAILKDGTYKLTSGGGSSKIASTTVSSKAIKGTVSVVIDKGTYTIDSSDDALHSNGSIAVYGGTYTISTADDGVHAETALDVNGGDMTITKSYEGLESQKITINKGTIRLTASDDGVNGAGGESTMTQFGAASSGNLYINGGYLAVNANGDGLDINGSIEMTGGSVIVHGPTNNGNGPLDYDGSFILTGGYVCAAGSSGMAQAPGTNSTQYSLLLNFSTSQKAGNIFHIQASDGSDILTFVPVKAYQSVAFSSSSLKNGATYDVYTGGSSTGTSVDGLYTGGTYSGGTKYTSFTVSGIITKITK